MDEKHNSAVMLDEAEDIEENLELPQVENPQDIQQIEKLDEYKPVRKKGFRYGCYLFVKRSFDIISSLLVIIILSWFILLCLLIKWLEDFHNPVYVSTRVGKDGKRFKILKIRTMVPNAEEMKQQLIDAGLNEADPPAFKMKNDPRITKVGKFFRKFSI